MRLISIPAGKNLQVVDKVVNDMLHFIAVNNGEIEYIVYQSGSEYYDPEWKIIVKKMDDMKFPDVFEKLKTEEERFKKKLRKKRSI